MGTRNFSMHWKEQRVQRRGSRGGPGRLWGHWWDLMLARRTEYRHGGPWSFVLWTTRCRWESWAGKWTVWRVVWKQRNAERKTTSEAPYEHSYFTALVYLHVRFNFICTAALWFRYHYHHVSFTGEKALVVLSHLSKHEVGKWYNQDSNPDAYNSKMYAQNH